MLWVSTSERYRYPLPEGHRFPIEKYGLVEEKLLREGVLQAEQLYHPGKASREILGLAHTKAYVDQCFQLSLPEKQLRALGLPLTELSLKRARCSVAGTLKSVQYALEYGAAANLGGGTHHAYADRPEGFCLFNDLAVAAAYAVEELGLKSVLVYDLDVHQGNGTAAIFRTNRSVFTFSCHCAQNYPLRKETSDRDIALPEGTGDNVYLSVIKQELPALLNQLRPDLVLYQAGADVLAGDRLGKFALSPEAVAARDRLVFEAVFERNIPIVTTLGGGYHKRLSVLVDTHAKTIQLLSHFCND